MNHEPFDLFVTPIELAEVVGITVQGIYKILRENGLETKNERGRHKLYPKEMRKFIELRKLPIPKAIFAVHIVKGGVGKTTIVHGLASRASAFGLKTLMIDLDQQANLTTSFGVYTIPKQDPTLLEVYLGQLNGKKVTIQDVVVPLTDYLHLIPANLNIANLDLQLIQATENIGTFFSELLSPISDQYDLIFLDCPPALSRITAAAHCYANHILLPVNTDRFSLDGLELTLDHLTTVKKKFDINSEIHIIINKFDARQKILGNATIVALTNKYQKFLCDSYISVSKQIDNSIAAHECIWKAKGSHNQALEDLQNLLIELLNLGSWKEREKQKELKEITNPFEKTQINEVGIDAQA